MQTKSEMINRIAELARENAELKAYKDVNEDFKTAWEELKAENKKLKEENNGLKSQLDFEIQRRAVAENATEQLEDEYCKLVRNYKELQEENKQHIKEKQILNERLYCYAYEKDCHLVCKQQNCLLKDSYKYRSALQEIKAIVCGNYEIIDPQGRKDILKLINKTEIK